MNRVLIAALVTLGLILWAHQLDTIGGRVPMVFVSLWFGTTMMAALVFTANGRDAPADLSFDAARREEWRRKVRLTAACLAPFALVPLIERRGVGNDPAIWLLDGALIIALGTAPYFTQVARTAAGGAVLSVGAFQALWIIGASICYRVMERSIRAGGGQMGADASFEDFFRRPEYRYLFYILGAVMILGYCPTIFWLGRRRFLRQGAQPGSRR